MAKAQKPKTTGSAKKRCAIYTRKSSEEGLEQDYNSLDAQRDACEAYIRSQKHEGWRLLNDVYDDGGFSGGSMDRPGLERLLDDIKAGQIDVVVVYKVDRLTRSLSDFARMVEIFDAAGVSFVSVTQAFNTTSSMGRLTLNVLLSFAQFEREVTGERIRDKIAASKKKGMWMGGLPPLGYDVKNRKLIINEAEAETVRHIFRRYATLKSVNLLKAELDHNGIVSKRRETKCEKIKGGRSFGRGALYHLLQNRIYLGDIVHKGAPYPGQHDAIIDQTLWEAVQQALADNRIARTNGAVHANLSLLAGFIFDARGESMTATHANKRGTRYRYYVSKSLIAGSRSKDAAGQRIPAQEIEPLVLDRICRFLNDRHTLLATFGTGLRTAADQHRFIKEAHALGVMLDASNAGDLCTRIQTITRRIDVLDESIEIHLDRVALWKELMDADYGMDAEPDGSAVVPIHLTIQASLKRTGIGKRLVIRDQPHDPDPDQNLIDLIRRTYRIQQRLLADPGLTLKEIATQEDVVPSYVTRLLRLSFLAPNIVRAILDGQQPAGLTATRLSHLKHLPHDWSEQRRLLGFA